MGEMAALWGYEENHDMEQLGQKLLFTTLELEKLKSEAMEEMKKNKEYIKNLIHLLKYAIHERDEAKNQLQTLLNNTNNNNNIPLFKPAVKANSSITESNSLSETHNYHSRNSSPVDSLFDGVSSSEFSSINMNNNQVLPPRVDEASLLIDSLVKGRALPQKGKFLQAVLQAGPLLQTLLVAGPLPRWRNPPQFQPFGIPPLSIKGCEVEALSQKPPVHNAQAFGQVNCGQVGSASMLSFGSNVGYGGFSCPTNTSLVSSGMNGSGYGALLKRQRLS